MRPDQGTDEAPLGPSKTPRRFCKCARGLLCASGQEAPGRASAPPPTTSTEARRRALGGPVSMSPRRRWSAAVVRRKRRSFIGSHDHERARTLAEDARAKELAWSPLRLLMTLVSDKQPRVSALSLMPRWGGREGSRDAGTPPVYERPRKGMSSTTRAMSITATCQTTPAEAWCIRESPTIPWRDLATDQLSSTNRRRIADEAPTNRR